MSRPACVVDAALPVGDGDDLRAESPASSSAETEPTLPKPCTATVAPLMSKPRCLAASRVTIITPRPVASRRPSDPPISIGLPVTTAVDVWPTCMRVGVHHPRHDLLVGVDVGRRDVFLRPDGVDDLGDVAAGQRFELAPRHLGRVADDAALAAAERDVRDRAFPRHPRRERGDFVERDAGVIADAALRRAERDVVLHAIAGEHLDLAVVHLDRTRDDDLPLGMGQDLPDAGVEVEDAGGSVEFLEHRIEDRCRCRHDAPVSRKRGQPSVADRQRVKRTRCRATSLSAESRNRAVTTCRRYNANV